MVRDEISSEGRISPIGIPGNNSWINKFELLETKIEEINNDIVSTRKLADFVINEMVICNERISNLFYSNQRRLTLLGELNNKLSLLCDQRDRCGKDMKDLIPNNVFFKSDDLNK